jgi:alpha-glucosidase
LPGSLYIYQGDELGLDEVEDLPPDHLQDPMVARSGGVDPGRDGCRVPLPWSGTAQPFGFSPPDRDDDPWLPQPARWAELTVEAQGADERSMLALYRRALAIRSADPDLANEAFAWLPSGPDVLSFRRGDRFVSITNFGAGTVPAPGGAELLLASQELHDGCLPTDSTGWWRLGPAPDDDR